MHRTHQNVTEHQSSEQIKYTRVQHRNYESGIYSMLNST